MSKLVYFGLAVCLLTLSVHGASPDPKWLEPLLLGNWASVTDSITSENPSSHDALTKLVLAHAFLALNRNNESLNLFLTTNDDSSLKQWRAWTHAVLDQHATNSIAMYLAADSDARLADYKNAEWLLDSAIAQNSKFFLAYNARGLVRMLLGRSDEALLDFHRATGSGSSFADAFASLGTYWIYQEAPDGALEAYNRAIELNPQFALAYNGRGCAYFGTGKFEYERALDDESQALQILPSLFPALSNQGLILAAIESSSRTGTSNAKDAELGSNLVARSNIEDGIDYTKFSTAREFSDFNRSVQRMTPEAGVRTLSNQINKVNARRDTLNEIVSTRRDASSEAEKLALGSKAMEMTVGMFSVGPLEAPAVILQSGLKVVEPLAKAYGYVAQTQIQAASAEIALRNRQMFDLASQRSMLSARLTNYETNSIEPNVLTQTARPSQAPPIRQISIPERANLNEYRGVADSISDVMRNAKPSELSSINKTAPVVVIAGTTDADRMGTMIRALEAKGIQAIPAIPGSDPKLWARSLGAQQVVQIGGPDKIVPFQPRSPAGGISLDMSHGAVDQGGWPVTTYFGLAYVAKEQN